MQLLRARDAVMLRFRPHLKTLGLTDQQGRILRVLAEAERLEMGELAERTCIHPASLSRIIPRLHKRGIVRRWKDRDDARRVAVSITKRGLASFAVILAESERIYADLAAEIGSARMREPLPLSRPPHRDRRRDEKPTRQVGEAAPGQADGRNSRCRKASILGHASVAAASR